MRRRNHPVSWATVVVLVSPAALLCCRTEAPTSARTGVAETPRAAGATKKAPRASAPAAGKGLTAARPPGKTELTKASCGFMPRGRKGRNRAYFRYKLGCGVSKQTWRDVVDVNSAAMFLGKKRSVVWMVFTDAAGKRVLPLGRKVTYDFRFQKRLRGTIRLKKSQARDGVFRLELPGNEFAKPCRSHLYIYFHNGKKRLEAWIDDWRYRC